MTSLVKWKTNTDYGVCFWVLWTHLVSLVWVLVRIKSSLFISKAELLIIFSRARDQQTVLLLNTNGQSGFSSTNYLGGMSVHNFYKFYSLTLLNTKSIGSIYRMNPRVHQKNELYQMQNNLILLLNPSSLKFFFHWYTVLQKLRPNLLLLFITW